MPAPDGDRAHRRAPGRHLDVARSGRSPNRRGVVEGGLLTSDAKVGDIVKVEADVDLEGISILNVIVDRGHRSEPERLELLGSQQPFEPVVTTLAARFAHRASAAPRPPASSRRRSRRRPACRRGASPATAATRARDGREDCRSARNPHLQGRARASAQRVSRDRSAHARRAPLGRPARGRRCRAEAEGQAAARRSRAP